MIYRTRLLSENSLSNSRLNLNNCIYRCDQTKIIQSWIIQITHRMMNVFY
eukprot:UN13849